MKYHLSRNTHYPASINWFCSHILSALSWQRVRNNKGFKWQYIQNIFSKVQVIFKKAQLFSSQHLTKVDGYINKVCVRLYFHVITKWSFQCMKIYLLTFLYWRFPAVNKIITNHKALQHRTLLLKYRSVFAASSLQFSKSRYISRHTPVLLTLQVPASVGSMATGVSKTVHLCYYTAVPRAQPQNATVTEGKFFYLSHSTGNTNKIV